MIGATAKYFRKQYKQTGRPDDRIAEVEASYESPHGRIEVLSVLKGGTWTYSATVPANTTATFLLPAEGGTFTVNGKEESTLNNCDGIVCLGRENGAVRFESSCGTFRFVRRA